MLMDSPCLPDFSQFCSKTDCLEIRNQLEIIKQSLEQIRQPLFSLETCDLTEIIRLLNDVYSKILENQIRIEENKLEIQTNRNLINQLLINIQNVRNYIDIGFYGIPELECSENEETGELELSETSVIFPLNLGQMIGEISQKQLRNIHKDICLIDSGNDDCAILIDDNSVFKASGYYVVLYWKWEDKSIRSGLKATTIRQPIDELINPTNPETIWSTYFANLYKIIGNQWSSYWTNTAEGNRYKFPFAQGFFLDSNEAVRYFTSLNPLTKDIPRINNNPIHNSSNNNSNNIVNTGKTVYCKKACVVEKALNTNQVNVINQFMAVN